MSDRLRVLDGVCAVCRSILIRSQESADAPMFPNSDAPTRTAILDAGLVPRHYEANPPLRVLDVTHKPGCSRG